MFIVEVNGFNRSNPNAQTMSTGADLLEIWQLEPNFVSPVDRAEYFNQPRSNHCLIVSLNEDNLYRFALDDVYVDQIYPPTLNLPSDASLEQMLTNLVS